MSLFTSPLSSWGSYSHWETHEQIAITLTPRMVLFASFSIASFGSFLPVWGWLDVVFTLMVLVGVCGESSWVQKKVIRDAPNDLMPVEGKQKKLGKIGERFLIIGLAGQLICLPYSLIEAAQLNKKTAKIKTTNAQLIADNLKLKRQVLELEAKFQPRQFSDEAKQAASSKAGRFLGTLVSIRWLIQDPETDTFAHSLGELLTSAGWKVNMDEGWSLSGSGILIDCRRAADANATVSLNDFLNSCGFASNVTREQNWSDSPDASIIILVGSKGSKVSVGNGPSHF